MAAKISSLFLIVIPIFLLLVAGVIVGIVFLVKYLIRYNAQIRNKKSRQQEELHRMKLNDL